MKGQLIVSQVFVYKSIVKLTLQISLHMLNFWQLLLF